MTDTKLPQFLWPIQANTEAGAEFTMLPHRIHIRAVLSDIVACRVCAVHRYKEVKCGDMPACDRVTLVPIDDPELMAEIARMRLRGDRYPSGDMSISLDDRRTQT